MGIGFSPFRLMQSADIIMGYVGSDGPHVSDYWAPFPGQPTFDTIQNVVEVRYIRTSFT